ncbi:MAG TPA: tetratricopeptide repeat protein, partial [Lachnospiraceae bacterium]|nr:tetratricopeptide repeat protein [Lachnospiraceae bacterium]
MGRFASNLKFEEIKRLAQAKQYMKAMKILDTLNVDKIRKMADLMLIAEILINNERYDEAMEILLRIYDKSCSRKIIESLIELSIKMKNYEEAEEFFRDYLRIAPKDPYRWILKYRIDKARHVSNNDLIDTLESLKREDYSEEWAYELAKLYHKTKQVDKCVDECNDIVLWFGQGIIVDKAKLLREHYTSGLNLTEGFGAGEFDATRSLEEVIRQVKYLQSQKTESQVKDQEEMLKESDPLANDFDSEVSVSIESNEDKKDEYGAYADDELVNSISENLTKNIGINIAKELNVNGINDSSNREDKPLHMESEEVHDKSGTLTDANIEADREKNITAKDSSQIEIVRNETAATIETKESKVHTLTE